ncbi:hypothetical protein N9N67_10010 [Bacteriovoracaceae bacterium]|nr:hypothetical protein [Bacteriovoracaceae bacterium]
MNKFTAILSLGLMFLFVSCGGSNRFVKDLKVKPSIDQGDVIIETSAQLYLGNITLPGISLPIKVPHMNNKVIGQLDLISNSSSDELKIKLNVSEIINLQRQVSSLPNGSGLPLMGVNQVVELNIGNKKNVHLYLLIGESQISLGVAIKIKGMDKLGDKVGHSAFFPPFNIKNVYGAGGVFTSKSDGKNGIGLFLDLTEVIPQQIFNQNQSSVAGVISYKEVKSSSRKRKKLLKGIIKLHRKKAKLK